MDRNTILKSIFCAAALVLAACTQDYEMADAAAGDANSGEALPEGMYPLQIGGVSLSAEVSEQPWGAKEPWTRVAETDDGSGSVFEPGDKFYVKFEGSDEVGTYKITESGGVEAVKPVYWTEKTGNIIAWYISGSDSEDAARTVDLSDQSGGLAYVMRAVTPATIGDNVSLTFTHQLSKVRVSLRGTAYEDNDTGVTLTYPASCHVEEGKVTSSTDNEEIKMYKAENADYYEALVPSGTIKTGDNPFKVTLGDQTVAVNLSSDQTLEAGKKYDVTLKIHKSGTKEIDLFSSGLIDIWDDGIYYVTGSYSTNSNGGIGGIGDIAPIQIWDGSPTIYFEKASISLGEGGNAIEIRDGSPTIYLKEASISSSEGSAIYIVYGGSTTIHVVGDKNSVTSGNGTGISVGGSSTVTITGNSRADVLTVKGGAGGCGIGGYGSRVTGNIEIRNVTIYATGSYDGQYICSPAIGGVGAGVVETITIDNATVYAYGVVSPDNEISSSAIGAGIYNYGSGIGVGFYETITIQNNSDVYVSRGNSYSNYIGDSGSSKNTASGVINLGDGTCTNSTVYCYTGETLEKTFVYDADGTRTEQSQ